MNTEYRMLLNDAHKIWNDWESQDTLSNVKPAIGIVDTGIFPHSDFAGSIIDFYDCVNNKISVYDNNGHGTHIAGIIAGTGNSCKGVCAFNNVNIVAVKGLNHRGGGSINQVVRGIEYLINNKDKYNIRIINISIGGDKNEYLKYKPLIDIVEEAWDRGILVCVAAGNNGPGVGSVTIPGNSRKVITVGSVDDDIPVDGGNRKKIVDYSGRGPTLECVIKPDIVTYGANILSCANNKFGYTTKSGTSMSTAIVTGAAAMLLCRYPDLKPKDIKIRLKNSAIDLKKNKNIQGAGALNINSFFNL